MAGFVTSLSSLRFRRCQFMLIFLLIIFGPYFVLCENVNTSDFISRSGDTNSLLSFKVNTCCRIDLHHQRESACRKSGPSDNITTTLRWTFPPHLMSTNETTSFGLRERQLYESNCDGIENVSLPLSGAETHVGDRYILENAYFRYNNEFYHPEEYCINGKDERSLHISVCKQNCKGGRPCIRKCCGLDKVYSMGLPVGQYPKGCQDPPKGSYFIPKLHADFWKPLSGREVRKLPGPHYILKNPSSFKDQCDSNKVLFFAPDSAVEVIRNMTGLQYESLQFRLRKDGKILYRVNGRCEIIDPEEQHICIDGLMNFGDGSSFSSTQEETVIFLCALKQPENTENNILGSKLMGSLMLVASVFLLLTVLVYLLLWERQNVHGWAILSHTVALFFMYVFLGTSHLVRVEIGHTIHNTGFCVLLAVGCHFFTLSTFSWLTIISFDLWLTFRAITPRSNRRSKGCCRYIKYCFFGWGVPSVIITVALVLDAKFAAEEDCVSLITPGYGEESCFLQQSALGYYYYLPMAVMLAFNLIFFIITSYKLYEYRKSTRIATKDETLAQFYRLFIKLFFVMGVLWVFEVISWAVSGLGFHWYWAVFDIINILRAPAVFLIFVCKRDIIKSLREQYPRIRPCLVPCVLVLNCTGSDLPESESVALNQSTRSTMSTRISTSMSTQTPAT